jgi:hypothetical protein
VAEVLDLPQDKKYFAVLQGRRAARSSIFRR